MKADTRFLRHWLAECCSSARVVLLVWVRLPLTCRPAYLKMWWACRRACFKTLPVPVCLHGSAVLEARGVLEEGRGSCNAYVKVCRAATARTWAFLENVWDFILCVVLQVGLFPGGDPRDREKTRMVPHCRNPIFLQTFSLWVFKSFFFLFYFFYQINTNLGIGETRWPATCSRLCFQQGRRGGLSQEAAFHNVELHLHLKVPCFSTFFCLHWSRKLCLRQQRPPLRLRECIETYELRHSWDGF